MINVWFRISIIDARMTRQWNLVALTTAIGFTAKNLILDQLPRSCWRRWRWLLALNGWMTSTSHFISRSSAPLTKLFKSKKYQITISSFASIACQRLFNVRQAHQMSLSSSTRRLIIRSHEASAKNILDLLISLLESSSSLTSSSRHRRLDFSDEVFNDSS